VRRDNNALHVALLTNAVLRARDAQRLAQAKREIEEMLERVRRASE
jgi:hypothetical protein